MKKNNNYKNKLRKKGENVKLIESLEKIILSKRKNIFKPPKQNDSVILLISGGMDSIVAWAQLMDKYKLNVYPLMVTSSFYSSSVASVNYFSKIFKLRYPQKYRNPYFVKTFPIDKFFAKQIEMSKVDPEILFARYSQDFNLVSTPISGGNMFSFLPAYYYLELLRMQGDATLSTIFCGVTSGDGSLVKSQTYLFMRLISLLLIFYSGNNSVQFSSIYYEEFVNRIDSKEVVFRLGNNMKLPMYKTYSCDSNKYVHCGKCVSCRTRRHCFTLNKLKDKTFYLTNLWENGFVARLKYWLHKFG